MISVVERVSEQVFIPLTVGGGLRKVADVRRMLEAGADKASLNTAAVLDPTLIADASDFFGVQCIVVAIDAKAISEQPSDMTSADQDGLGVDEKARWEVYTHGGRNPTGLDAVKWAERAAELGAGELLVTSMDTDGQRAGYDVELIREHIRERHRAGDRQRRRGHPGPPLRGTGGRQGRRGAGGLYISLRDLSDRRGQGASGRPGRAGPARPRRLKGWRRSGNWGTRRRRTPPG